MDNETEDIYLQKLEEFIVDEDKIVTVTWLSHKLSISASESRRLLSKYVKDHRVSKPDELAVIYLLSVILEDDVLAVSLIKESEIEEKTKKFKKVIEQQIYSVQKCKQVDFVPTSLIDPFDAGETKDVPIKDAIVSKLCIPRTFKVKKALPPPPAPVLKGKMSVFLNAATKSKEPSKSTDVQKTGFENNPIKKENKEVPEPKVTDLKCNESIKIVSKEIETVKKKISVLEHNQSAMIYSFAKEIPGNRLVDETICVDKNLLPQPSIASVCLKQVAMPKKGIRIRTDLFPNTRENYKNKKNGIASFFTQSNVKPKIIKEEVKETQITQKEKMQANVKVEVIKEEAMEVDKVEVLDTNKKPERKNRLKGLIDSDSEEDDFKPTAPTPVKENGKSEKVSRKRSKKTKKKDCPAPKRLKKIVNQRDSDSDDIFGNDEPEENFHDDIIENSEEESQPSQKVKILPPKNKKRKLVDKTYTDEEGFIITNKEWVDESPSEDEEKPSQVTESESPKDIPVKEEKENKMKNDNKLNKIANNETNGKTSAKGKGVKGKKIPSANQMTLMSFFKKN